MRRATRVATRITSGYDAGTPTTMRREPSTMPFVSVQMLEGRSDDQKKRLAKAITDALIEIANAKLESCEVVIEEHPRRHWMTAGKMMSEV